MGLYNSKMLVRDAFATNLELICEKVKQNKGVKPLFYIFQLLKNNFPDPKSHIPSTESWFFFQLFSALILQYQDLEEDTSIKDDTPKIDFKEFLVESLNRLKDHESSEKENSSSDDKTLIGLATLC